MSQPQTNQVDKSAASAIKEITPVPGASEMNEVSPAAPSVIPAEKQPAEEIKEQKNETKAEIKEDTFSKRFKELSRREKELRTKEQAFKQKAAAFEDSLMNNLKKSAIEDPFKVLEQLGVSYDGLTSALLTGKKPQIDAELKKTQAALEERIGKLEQEKKQMLQQQAEERIRQTRDAYFSNVERHLADSADKYPLTRALKKTDLIEPVVEAHWEKTLSENGKGELITPEAALIMIEEYLSSEYPELLEAIKKPKTDKTEEKSSEKAGNKQINQPKAENKSITLSNKHTVITPSAKTGALTEAEQRQLQLEYMRKAKGR